MQAHARREPREEPLAQLALVARDRVPAERVDVVDGCDEAREQLVLQRAQLEARPDRLVRRRSHLVRPPAREQVAFAEREPEMRAVELVRRAEEHVDVPGGGVDRAVRAVVDGVGPGERARRVGEVDDAAHIERRADRVRGDREGNDTRSIGELPLQVVVVEPHVIGHLDEADDDAEVVLQLQPRRHVRVVVELRHEHLVAGSERSRERAREEEVETRHARPERDLLVAAAEERSRTLTRVRDQRIRAPRGLVGSAGVGVRLPEVAGDRVDHLVRALRPARAVEEGERSLERAEPRANCVDVVGDGRAHARRA